MITIKPLGERVLLQLQKKEEKTSGGIYIPESAQKEKKEGLVIAVGMTPEGKELPLKPGDRVLYGGYSNEEFELDGKEYLLVEWKDVLAKVE